MPPKRARSSQESIEQKGRILLAMRDIQNGSTDSIRQIAERVEVRRSALTHGLDGFGEVHPIVGPQF